MPNSRLVLLCLVLLASLPPGLTAQSIGELQPGDSVRFNVPSVIEFRDASGAVTAVETVSGGGAGRFVLVDGDTLVIDQAGDQRRLAIASIDDVRVRRRIESPRTRGFKRGAVFGGVILGAVGAGIGLCNPDIFGGGCQGGTDLSIMSATTFSGAAVGALVGGIFGALLAPEHRWQSIQVALPVRPDDGSVAFGIRLASPR
jgi:outer membrane lipoprotein SlyB